MRLNGAAASLGKGDFRPGPSNASIPGMDANMQKKTFDTVTVDGTRYPLVMTTGVHKGATGELGKPLDSLTYSTPEGEPVTFDGASQTFAFVHNGQKIVTRFHKLPTP